MKTIFASILIATTITASANTLERMTDGLNASCAVKSDIIRSRANNVYNLSDAKITKTETTVELKINIDFLACTETNEEYSFKKLNHHMSATYTYPDFVNGGIITATRIDKNKSVVAYNEQYEIIGKSKILKSDGQYYLIISIDTTDLDINNFPMAQDKGNYYTTLMLRVQSKVVTPTIDLGYSLKSSGTFRLFFDL